MRPRKKPKNQSTDSRFDDYPELATIVTAKRMGLSFDELNCMTMSDYVDFLELWIGDDPDEDTVRAATPDDIKRVFG